MQTFEHPGQEVANSNEPSSHGIQLILLAQSWGPKNGGINAFNTDFAKALGRCLGPERVVCVTLEATPEEVADAGADHVRLIPVAPGRREFDPMYAEAVLRVIGEKGIVTGPTTFWIGHDVHTGPAALRVAELVGHGRSVVIQHMSYGDYISFRDGIGQKALEKQRRQEELYRQADVVFAVGPLLRDRLSEIVHDQGKPAHMIVPGLADIQPSDAPRAVFRAVAMGRLGPGDDRIKQGRLALAAVASAIREAHEDPAWPEILQEAEMRLYGIEQPGGEEEEGLRILAEEAAERGMNLLPLPFTHDRPRLLRELSHCDVALMLSWHEGFGLTGWEAIAAGVPLIASEKSGLYQLIKESLGDVGLILFEHLKIRGTGIPNGTKKRDAGSGENYRPEDVEAVQACLLKLAKNRDKAKKNAKQLRQMLVDNDYTWDNAAAKYINDLRWVGEECSESGDGSPPVLLVVPVHKVTTETALPRVNPDVHSHPATPIPPSPSPERSEPDPEQARIAQELKQTARRLIVAFLSKSDAAAKEMARRLKLSYEKSGTFHDAMAERIMDEPLSDLFDQAIRGEQALLGKGDKEAADAIAGLIQSILPARHELPDIVSVRAHRCGGASGPVQLMAGHRTIAEIIMAGTDRRPTWLVLAKGDYYPRGKAQVAQHSGLLEIGRDAVASQFKRDVTEELLRALKLLIGIKWKERDYGDFPTTHEELQTCLSANGETWFRETVQTLVRTEARANARKLPHEECEFTYYFLVGTPPGIAEDQLNQQNAALQGLHRDLFPDIACLRLAPITDINRSEMNPYDELHYLLNPTEAPR